MKTCFHSDELIEQELILFVTLNVNKNTEPVRALGKMLLQNLQLVVGKRYESDEQRRIANRPLFSGRARRIRALWIPELSADPADRARHQYGVSLLHAEPPPAHARRPWVQRGCASPPNTTMTLRTRDEETARYFCEPRRNIRSHGAICRWSGGSSSGSKGMRRLAGAVDVSKPRKLAHSTSTSRISRKVKWRF